MVISVRLTRSRLARGFLTVERKYQSMFPPQETTIRIYLGESKRARTVKYTPASSTAKEVRIYGLRSWFRKHGAKPNDKVEITREVDGYRLRLITVAQQYQKELASAQDERQARKILRKLAKRQSRDEKSVALEQLRLLARQRINRRRRSIGSHQRLEVTPPYIRTLLAQVYEGRCQICGYTFKKRDGTPYFEIHHLNPEAGHNPKNLLVVCANCHRRLEHARYKMEYSKDGWAIEIAFNGERYSVNQALRAKS